MLNTFYPPRQASWKSESGKTTHLVHLKVAAKGDDTVGLVIFLEHVARARAVTLGVRHDERTATKFEGKNVSHKV